jgi:hypothetical protein
MSGRFILVDLRKKEYRGTAKRMELRKCGR